MVSETYWHWLISDIAFLAILLEENAPIILYFLGPGLWSMITQPPHLRVSRRHHNPRQARG